MADGTAKRIDEIEVGDRVLAADPRTGKVAVKPVVAVMSGEGDKELVQLTVDADGPGGDDTAAITVTGPHPFWVPDLREWRAADSLRVGQTLRTSEGARVEIVGVTRWSAAGQRVHNLTIGGFHTYHVTLDGADALVHNAAPCGTGLRNASAGLKELFADGSIRGRSIISIREILLRHGFTRKLANNKKGYRYVNNTGEEVRIMYRNGQWDLRIRNRDGNWLDEYGNSGNQQATHEIIVKSK